MLYPFLAANFSKSFIPLNLFSLLKLALGEKHHQGLFGKLGEGVSQGRAFNGNDMLLPTGTGSQMRGNGW